MRFETDKDLQREEKAIQRFVSLFGGSYNKLGPHDVDYAVYDKYDRLISFVEVKGRNKTIAQAFPLPIACRKIEKLRQKQLNPVIIWDCLDGYIYGKLKNIKGVERVGGRTPRRGASNDIEWMTYYADKSQFTIIKH